MKRSNPNSYPITYQFENFLIDEGIVFKLQEGSFEFPEFSVIFFEKAAVGVTAKKLHEMLGEYEHGTVDWNVVLEMVGMEEEAKWIKKYYHGQTNDLDQDDHAAVLQKKALEILESVYEDILLTMKHS